MQWAIHTKNYYKQYYAGKRQRQKNEEAAPENHIYVISKHYQ
jgi:hypothetical protein